MDDLFAHETRAQWVAAVIPLLGVAAANWLADMRQQYAEREARVKSAYSGDQWNVL